MLINTKQDNKFVTILSDGTLRLPVPEYTEGSVRREYETSDGKTGVKHELVFTEISGYITKVEFKEGDFGKLLQVTMSEEGEDDVIVSIQTGSNFGEDLMKKLPAIDTQKKVRLVPYAFTDENGKSKKGLTVYQDEQKVQNFFQEGEGDKRKMLHGFPEIPKVAKGKTISSDEWKMYFMQCRIFLINYIEENFKVVAKGEVVGKGADLDF